jgi:DNA-binding MarR family transcriptional regulator
MPAAFSRRALTKADYELLAAWRHALRRFLAFSRAAAEQEGIPPQQHQALLAIKGFPGREQVTVGELAERLLLRHHSAVGLVDRLVRQRLVRRVPSATDRRRVHVALTPAGEAIVRRLSTVHLDELRQLRPQLRRLVDSMVHPRRGPAAARSGGRDRR